MDTPSSGHYTIDHPMAKKKVTTPEEEVVDPNTQDPTVPASLPEGQAQEETPEVEDETPTPQEELEGEDATEKPAEDAAPSNAPQEEASAPQEEPKDKDATEEHVEDADTPEATEGEAPEEAETGGDAQDEEEEEDTTYEDEAPSALSDMAAQILRDNDLDVVFLTIDGTAFYGYSDAINYAQTLADDSVQVFFRTPPTDEDYRRHLPPHLRPKHLQSEL